MPLASQLGFEESSLEISSSSTPPRAQALSVRPEAARQSDSSSSGPIRRNRARSLSYGPASRSSSLQPAPTFAANVGPARSQNPTGPNTSHQELHLHQHAHRQQVLQVGVDPVAHANMQSEATSAIMNARAETAAVFGEAEAVIQSLRSENQQLGAQAAAIQGESYAAIQALRSENQQLGSRASVIQGEAETVIGNLRTENQQLGEMNRELNQKLEKQAKMILEQQELSKAMHQQLIALQSHVQAAEPKNPSIPSSAIPASSTQNGADQAASAFNALQALAGEVGGTMRRIEQAIEASGSSGSVAPGPVEFGLPPYQCSRKSIFTGRLHSATPASPPPPPQKLKPQVFDIADEDDFDEHGEDEGDEDGEDFEDDPIVPVAAHEPEDDRDYESSIYKYKDLKDIKLPQIPGSSVEFRAYRNSVLTQIASIDCSGKAVLLKWLQKSLDPSGSIALTRSLQQDCEGLPRLDGWISACISDAKHLKGEWGLQAQSYLERCHASGTMPFGRALLSILSRRYRIDKVRGPLVTLQSLFDLEPDSFSYQSLVAFKQRVEYVLNGLPERQWPDAETMFSWIYSRLKGCRMLSRTIDRVKDAKPGSKRRTFEYIWNGLEEVLAEGANRDKGKGKGKGGGKDGKAKPQKPPAAKDSSAEQSGQRPACFFYPKGTCTRGKDCPFEHVDAPKKAAPSKAAPKVPAGVAMLAAASTGASACNIPSSFVRGFKATCRLITAPFRVFARFAAALSFALPATGILTDMFSDHIRSTKPLQFETGNGVTSSGTFLTTTSDAFGSVESYVLQSCPVVRSLGQLVELQRKPFVWLPGSMPFFGSDEDCVQITWDSDRVIYAHKVDDYVPVFREQIRFGGDGLHRALAAGESAPAAPAEVPAPAVPAEDPPLPAPAAPPPPDPGEGSGADDEGDEDAPTKAQRLITEAQTAPGVFAGWRFDSGPSSFREVYYVLDYGKLKNREPGYEKAISVPREEIHVPRGNPILPMFTAAEAALSSFTKAEYEAIEFLDVPFSTVAPSTPVAKRHEYITLDRLMRLGATPGCKACKFDGTVHTPVCKARFDGLIKAEKIAASKSVRDAAPPDVERPDPLAESAPAAPEGDEDAPERASSSAGPRAPAGVVVQSSESKVPTGEFGLSARFLANERARNNTRRVKELPGENVLIEYGCEDESEIRDACERCKVHCVSLSQSTLDLTSQDDMQQVVSQAIPGVDAWFTIPCTHMSSHQAVHRESQSPKYARKIAQRQATSKRMLVLALNVADHIIEQGGRVSFQWSSDSGVLVQPEWIDFASKHELSSVACVSGNKATTIASNSKRVLEHFAKVSTKESSEINATNIKAYELADLVIQSLFPQRYFKSVPNLGKASALITKNLSRREWQAEPKALEAIAQEAEGLRRNGTWDDTTAMPLHEILISLGGKESQEFPSNWFFEYKDGVLILNIYVDDLSLCGLTKLHTPFWQALRAKVKLDPECFIGSEGVRILGRLHCRYDEPSSTTMAFRMPEYAEQIVQTYCEITGTTPDKLRRVNTPCIAESSMTDEDISAQGELHDSASRILMRCLWLARLCRADIAFAVTRLASRVTRWTAWEDRQVLRLVSYIHHTRDVCMNASCSWDAAPELRVYTDADFAACPYTSRSTSGIVVHIGTGQHAFPVMWQSRKQTSVARSTPEAEMISMASAMFSEVINLQTFLQSAFKSTVPIIFFQDNETVLAILKSGYSPKLRHLGRVHRVNVASMAEIFEQEDFSATYVNSKEQLANGLTKIIPPAEWSDMLTRCAFTKVVAEEAERFASSLPRKITQEDLVQLLSYLPGESAGGHVWVQSQDGGYPCPDLSRGEKGEILKWPAIFDPRRLHATTPCTKGDRIVIIAFTPRNVSRLPVDSQLKLRELGFHF
ncbi:RE2 [Symbiodinium sp. CCMP2592]|nr:RE2 [Symbiodinium sp. CCMP2592]